MMRGGGGGGGFFLEEPFFIRAKQVAMRRSFNCDGYPFGVGHLIVTDAHLAWVLMAYVF